MSFPTTPILDDFNRADESPLSFGGQWNERALSTVFTMSSQSNQAISQATQATLATRRWIDGASESYAQDHEVYATLGGIWAPEIVRSPSTRASTTRRSRRGRGTTPLPSERLARSTSTSTTESRSRFSTRSRLPSLPETSWAFALSGASITCSCIREERGHRSCLSSIPHGSVAPTISAWDSGRSSLEQMTSAEGISTSGRSSGIDAGHRRLDPDYSRGRSSLEVVGAASRCRLPHRRPVRAHRRDETRHVLPGCHSLRSSMHRRADHKRLR